MKHSFFTLDGFFITWKSKAGENRIFTQSSSYASKMYATLKQEFESVEKYLVLNGTMRKVG